MKKALLFLSVAFAAISCNNNDLSSATPESGESTKTISVAVSLDSEADTRVNLTDDGNKGYTVTWNESDALGFWGTSASSYYQSKFTIAEYDELSSTFTGSLPWNTTEARFIHPYNSSFVQSNGVVSMSLASQDVAAGLDHLNANTYMISEAIDVDYIDEYTSGTKGSLNMTHIGAAIDLNLTSSGYNFYELTLIEVVISELPTAVEIDMTNDAAMTVTETGAITLTADNITTDSDTYTVSFNTFPFTLSEGSAISIEIIVYNPTSGYYYKGTRQLSASSDVEFARATRNTINAAINDFIPIDAPAQTFTVYPEDLSDPDVNETKIEDSVTVGDFDFTFGGTGTTPAFYITSDVNNLRLYSGNEMTISHSDKNITSVEFSFTSSGYAKISGADSGIYTSISDTKYAWYGDASSVTFTANGTNRIASIKITYGGDTSELAPIFSDVSVDEITFASDDTTATSVQISGVYLENATEMTTTLTDGSHFEVSDIADDFTFTVAPKGINNSGATYSDTVTVTVNGDSKSFDITQIAEGAATYSYVLIEDVDNITDGTYLLACEKSSVMYIADGNTTSVSYLYGNADDNGYYTASTKSFVSNGITDGYSVTIAVTDGGCTVQMGDGNYINGSTTTSMTFNTTEYEWLIKDDSTYGIYLLSNSGTRGIAFHLNSGNYKFSTYTPSTTYQAANLYKKIED